MSLHAFADTLYTTSVSTWIRETAGIIPTTQSIHILAIAVVVGSALVTDLRLAGVLATDESTQTVVRRYLPWMWAAIAVLLATGAIMAIGEPNRVLTNPVFWSKMALVVLAFCLTLLFRYPFLHPLFQIRHPRWASWAKPAAWVSLMVWIAVIFCGRWIAYAI